MLSNYFALSSGRASSSTNLPSKLGTNAKSSFEEEGTGNNFEKNRVSDSASVVDGSRRVYALSPYSTQSSSTVVASDPSASEFGDSTPSQNYLRSKTVAKSSRIFQTLKSRSASVRNQDQTDSNISQRITRSESTPMSDSLRDLSIHDPDVNGNDGGVSKSSSSKQVESQRPSVASDHSLANVGSYLFGRVVDDPEALNHLASTAESGSGSGIGSIGEGPHPQTFNTRTSSLRLQLEMQRRASEQLQTGDLDNRASTAYPQVQSPSANNEVTLQTLNNFEDGLLLLLSRVKESMHSSKEVAAFLKKKAALEEDYAKNVLKLCQNSFKTEGKGGTFQQSWNQLLRIQERVAETRLQNASIIGEMAEDVNALFKSTERSRKQLKDAGARFAREVHESEVALEKSKTKYEACSEDWERAQAAEAQQAQQQLANQQQNGSGASNGVTSGGGLRKNMTISKSLTTSFTLLKNSLPSNLKFQKSEEEARHKASMANEIYKSQLQTTNAVRNAYFEHHLPKLIRELKDTNDDCDSNLTKHLFRYCRQLETALMSEAQTISPLDPNQEGVVRVVEKINNAADFEEYMAIFFQSRKPINKTEHQYIQYKSPSSVSMGASPLTIGTSFSDLAAVSAMQTPSPSVPVFGIALPTMMETDPNMNPVPLVVIKCIEYIETHGMTAQGLYRLSGSGTHVQKLRHLLSRDIANCELSEHVTDIHAVTSLMKLFFRELPDPLFPRDLYKQFIEAAKIEDDRLRLIQIHELVNLMHDANYATLKCLAGHLWRVKAFESDNKMSVSNLSIVWGPTLMDSPDATPDPNELKHQSKVVETVIANFEHIFDTS